MVEASQAPAGATGHGGKGKAGAWIAAHKPQAAGIAGGAGLVGLLIYKKVTASSSTAATGTTGAAATTATPTTVVDSTGTGDAGDFNNVTNQLNGIGDALNRDFTTLDKGQGSPKPTPPPKPGKTGPAGPPGPPGPPGSETDTAGKGETNIPPSIANKLAAPIVAAIPGPDGGDLYLGRDGGVFATGGAKFQGSYPGLGEKTPRQFASIYNTSGGGYTLVDTRGELYHFGPAVKDDTPPPATTKKAT